MKSFLVAVENGNVFAVATAVGLACLFKFVMDKGCDCLFGAPVRNTNIEVTDWSYGTYPGQPNMHTSRI
jgi:hypothetical protein